LLFLGLYKAKMMCENAKIVKKGTHGTPLNSMQENDFLDVGDASFF